MTVTEEIKSEQLAELIKQVQAGNEVLLTKDQKPVAKLVATHVASQHPPRSIKVRSIKGHRVLTPNISNAEIADDMYGER